MVTTREQYLGCQYCGTPGPQVCDSCQKVIDDQMLKALRDAADKLREQQDKR